MSGYEGWQERLYEEQEQITQRVVKLNVFLNTREFVDLSFKQRVLLLMQAQGMQAYAQALTLRLQLIEEEQDSA